MPKPLQRKIKVKNSKNVSIKTYFDLWYNIPNIKEFLLLVVMLKKLEQKIVFILLNMKAKRLR